MPNTLLQTPQSAAFGASASARTLQYASNVTAGSLLACWVAQENNSGTTPTTISVSDNVNGAWTQAGTYVTNTFSGSGRRGSWWYFVNSAGGSKPIVTTGTPSASIYTEISIHEYGVPSPTSVTVDGTSTGAPNAPSTTTVSTGTCTVSASGELVVAGWGQGNANGETITVSSPFTKETSQTDGTTEGGGTADDTNASASEGATFTSTIAMAFPVAMAVSFKTSAPTAGLFLPANLSGLGSGGRFFGNPLN